MAVMSSSVDLCVDIDCNQAQAVGPTTDYRHQAQTRVSALYYRLIFTWCVSDWSHVQTLRDDHVTGWTQAWFI